MLLIKTESANLQNLREEVCEVNRALFTSGLVTMHSGNASGIDPVEKRLLIKSSGVDYASLTPEMLVEVDLSSGQLLDRRFRPRVDLPQYLYLYSKISAFAASRIHS